VTQSEGSC